MLLAELGLLLAAFCFAAFCRIISSAVCCLATVNISAAPALSSFSASDVPRCSAACNDEAETVPGAATMAA